MRRGFGRRRRRPAEEGPEALDPAELRRVTESGLVEVELEPFEVPGIPSSVALVGRGKTEDESQVLVTRAASLAEALAAALVVRAAETPAEGEAPRILAVAGEAREDDRLQLAALGELPANLTSHLLESDQPLAKPGPEVSVPVPVRWFADRIEDPRQRLLTDRTLDGLSGLAAKHGGSLRAHGDTAELCVSARPVASLSWSGDVLQLHTLLPQKSQAEVSLEGLSDLLDRLEGNIRKRLSDRKVRDGDEGLRGRCAVSMAQHLSLRSAVLWPLSGQDPDPVDVVGVGPQGELIVAAVREEFGLSEALQVMGGLVRVRELLPALLANTSGPVRTDAVRLVIAAESYSDAVEPLLAHLRFPMELLSIVDGAKPLPSLVAKGEAPGVPAPQQGEARDGRRGRSRRGRGRGRGRPDGASQGSERAPASAETPEAEEVAAAPEAESADRAEAAAPVVEEMSLFDLDDDAEGDGGRRRRRRGRRRGGRGGAREDEGGEATGEPPAAAQSARRSESADAESDDPDLEEVEIDDDGLPLVDPEAPEPEEGVDVTYDASELEEEPLTEAERLRLERERRRLARRAIQPTEDVEDAESEGEPAAPEEFKMPRGRPAILAAADRQSLAAALVLARDVRNIEGIWVYPQGELMTFFRGVATDLRENTPILIVGHPARPARDAIQAAALYRGRLVWFDHHDWAPEDEGSMREAIGSQALHLTPGLEGPLAAVLAQCNRRSRFTDKLVDLATGRFTQHDFERWGRLWWKRLAELAEKSGPVGSALDPLFAGRPSDLAREAARQATPDLPPELEFAASRDFRLVHFGGYGLAMIEVPEGLDLHLTARIVRERYDVALSLACHVGSEGLVLASDDLSGRRAIDCGSMVDHLVSKFSWVEALPDDDHVARMRIRDLSAQPERLEEVVADIAMGRSLLEG